MNFSIFVLVSSVLLLGRGSCFTIKKIDLSAFKLKNETEGELDEDELGEDKPGEDKPDFFNYPYVIGGNMSEVLPYHVYMECNDKYFCGGALISTQHVLTAAHCLKYTQKKKCAVKVIAGTNLRGNGSNGLYIMAKHGFIHPQYSEDTKEHDIGIFLLNYPFTTTTKIMPIRLTPYPPANDDLIMISGFGRTNRYNNEMSKVLQTYTSGLKTYESCRAHAEGKLHPTEVCDYGETDLGVCQGDSGSPVINRFYYLVAVVSRIAGYNISASGVPDCTFGTPNIFTSVYHHLDFINSCLSYNMSTHDSASKIQTD